MCAPFAILPAITVALATPAVVVDFQLERGRLLEICLNRDGFLNALSPEEPAQDQRSGPEMERDEGTAKTSGGDVDTGTQA
jgi:hypothetical protein